MAALLLAASPLLGGCFGLFKPATPQAPGGNGGVNLTTNYTTPDSALATMARGIAGKGLGNSRDAYVGAFADSALDQGQIFTATFDPDVAALYAGQIPIWNLALERVFYSDFVGLFTDTYYLKWSAKPGAGDDDYNYSTGDAVLYRKYEVFTIGADGNTSHRIAIGLVDLSFKQINSTRWAIVRWDDHVDPSPGIGVNPDNADDLSMSALRLRSRIGN